MFNFEPLTTSNILTVIQILVILFGFIFSWRGLKATWRSIEIASESLKSTKDNIAIATGSLSAALKSLDVSTSNAQAQLYNQMVLQGRDLQYKFMDEYHGSGSDEDRKSRQNILTGSTIGYYAACYGLRGILKLPESVTKLLDDELKQLMRQPAFKNKFNEISDNFSQEFIAYVNSLKGVK
ncbi:hypothetical protein QD460_25015 [Rhizobium jaguaris]|uniref:hypothetical protein n=1 Tax=Rhizobium jaguaris TaxID=1312183 RepID=UPI0039BFE2A8